MFTKLLLSFAGISVPVSSSIVSYYAYKRYKPNPNADEPTLISNDSKYEYPIAEALESKVIGQLNSYMETYVPSEIFSNDLKFNDTAEFQEDDRFASLSNFSEYWSRYSYPSNYEDLKELEPNPIDLTEIEHKFIKKSTVRNIFIDLLANFKSNIVGSLLNGVILEFPSDQENLKLWNLSSDFYLDGHLIPTFVDSQIYIQPFSSFSNSFSIQNYKDEFMTHKDKAHSIPNLSPNSSVSYISYASLVEKAKEWFKYWGDSAKQKEGDFYLLDKFSNISLANKKFVTFDIFKIHNGKQYKFSLIFKVSPSSNAVSLLRFRTIDKYWNRFNLHLDFKSNKIDFFFYSFYALSKLVHFPEGDNNKNLDIYDLGDISSGKRQIYWHERFSNVHYKVKSYRDYLDQIYRRE